MKVKIIFFIVFCLIILSCNTTNNNLDCNSASVVVNVISTNSSNISNTGTITVTSPISSEYTYKINSGTYQVNPSFINLAAGTYNVTAKNAAGCTSTKSVTISNFDCSLTVINVTGTAIASSSASDGSITITDPIGSDYSYSLNGSAFQTLRTFSALSVGTYTVVVKNRNGCIGSRVFEVTGCNSSNMNGIDTGSHSIFVGSIKMPIPDLRDTLMVTHSGNTINMNSKLFNRIITGTISPLDCDKFTLDSIIFPSTDTIIVETTTLGNIKFWNLRMGGTGDILTNGVVTNINVSKGNSNLISPVNISNLTGINMSFKGRFIKR